ncbi:MAG: DUF2723 domain-containing protein [Anaerolineales bacterium]|nr:DUF2723 domain-containing protein [Anaerolineales bacterium]
MPPRIDWWRVAIFGAAILVPFTVYLASLAPDLTWAHNGADGGDLIVAAYTLGVPHPPGYPAYTLLAHLFTWIPLGGIAYRVNLLSAVSAASAAGVVALIARELNSRACAADRFLGALVAAFGFAFTPLVWQQAVIAEVYAPLVLCVALVLLFSLRVGSPRGAFALGLVWGIALGIHLTALFLVPLVVWSLWRAHRAIASPRLWLAFITGTLLASLQWFYPVWRAGRGAITWGDPTTLQGWWWLVSGALYRDYLFAVPFDAWLGRIAFFLNALLVGLGPILCALAFVGWRQIAREDRGKAIVWSATIFAYIVFAIGYNSADSISLAIPAVMIFCVGIGAGVALLFGALRARFGNRAVAIGWIGLFVEVALMLMLNWRAISLADDRAAILFGEQVLNQLPPAAIVVTQDDCATFALWYFRYVLGQRPDAIVIDRDLMAFEWYQAQVGMTPARLERLVNRQESGSPPVCWIVNCCDNARVECAARK